MSSNFKIRNPSDKKFGITFSIIFVIIFFYFYYFKNLSFYILILFSFIFLVLSFFLPKFLNPLNKIWMKFGLILGSIVSQLVMAAVYSLFFVTIGLLLKLFKKDILDISLNKDIKTYWKNRSNEETNMENQF